MKRVLVFGACSKIIQEVLRNCASDGSSFFLLGRTQSKLESVAGDLRVRGAKQVAVQALDFCEPAQVASAIETICEGQTFDLVLVGHGCLGNATVSETHWMEAKRIIEVNFLSFVSILTALKPHLIKQGRGKVVVLSSVAGDRGRASNYVYGSAKGGLNVFLEGYRSSLRKSKVEVLTVKPGPTDTPMTSHLKKGLLMASPEIVGRNIYRATERKQTEIYLPSFWKWIMKALRALPEAIFSRLPI